MFETTLLVKVALLLSGSMVLGGLGAYLGRNIRTLGAFILLLVAFIAGAIAIPFAARASTELGLFVMFGWTFISGLFIAPAIQMYSQRLGWQTVAAAYLGTGAVMCGCGAFGMLSGINFSFMGSILGFSLLALIVVGLLTMFWRLSRTGRIVQSLLGMLIFSGYFIFDFFRITKSENTWADAMVLSTHIYLDYMNFFLDLLRLLEALSDK